MASIAEQIAAAKNTYDNEQYRMDDIRGQYSKGYFSAEGASNIMNRSTSQSGRVNRAKEEYDALMQRSQEDPWSFYRQGAADRLSKSFSNDPTQMYMSRLENMMSGEFGPDDPSYQWRLQQGQQALERSQASKGLLGSGNAAVELLEYGQGMASTEYQAQFERTLQGLAGVSQAYDTNQQRLMRLAGVDVDPGAMAGRAAGITQSQISANASMANARTGAATDMARLSENARQFNVTTQFASDYDQGVGEGFQAFSSFNQQI